MTRSNSLATSLCAAVALTLSASAAFAHGEVKPRFVAVGGVDSGACTDATAPCGTIMYAIKQAGKGDHVAVAKGTYQFDPEEAILSGQRHGARRRWLSTS